MIWSTQKAYVSAMLVILGLFGVYGIVDMILLHRSYGKFPTDGEWPFNQRLTVYFSTAANFSYVLAAIVGVIAVKSGKLFIFNWSAFILLVTFAIQLIHGVACIRAGMKSMTGNIFSTFRKYQNYSNYLDWLVDFQWEYDCCGIKSYMDWRIFAYKIDKYDVPESCCLRKDVAPELACGQGLTAPNVTVETAASLIHTLGCGDKISKIYQDDIQVLGFTLVFLAFLAVVAGMTIFVCQHQAALLRTQRRFSMQDHRLQHKSTEVASSLGHRASQSHEDCASETSDLNVHGMHARVVPSYYRSVGIQKVSGRGKGVRQDSVGNFQNRSWIPRYNPKSRAYQRQKASAGGQVKGGGSKYNKGAQKEMRRKLEMLMRPIETQSTNSAVPNPSSLFPFRTGTPRASSVLLVSKKDGEGGGGFNGNGVETWLPHYNSLPQVKTFPTTVMTYHYKASHLHAHVHKKKFPSLIKAGAGGGKFPSVMMVSNFPPIQEETESVTSRNSHASTGVPSASSSPKSLSKSSSKLDASQLGLGFSGSGNSGKCSIKLRPPDGSLTRLEKGAEEESGAPSGADNNNYTRLHG